MRGWSARPLKNGIRAKRHASAERTVATSVHQNTDPKQLPQTFQIQSETTQYSKNIPISNRTLNIQEK